MVCCLHNSTYLTAYICFYVKRTVIVACFSNYIGNTRSSLSILSSAARGGFGGVPEGGRRSRELAFGWSGVTYLEPLPGLTALWEEEREIAVLLVWTKWLRDHCQRELTERLPWLSAPLSGSTQNVFPRSRFSLRIRGSQPLACRPADDLN